MKGLPWLVWNRETSVVADVTKREEGCDVHYDSSCGTKQAPRRVLTRRALSAVPICAASARSVAMGLGRVELPTSRLSGVRSNHLSYRPLMCCNDLPN